MPPVCPRSKSTGDPWLTDGSYFDGTGYAEIKFESQFGTTKRFEQEIRVVSYNGIIFFLENQAGAGSPGEPSSLTGWAGMMPGLLAGIASSGRWGEEGSAPKPHSRQVLGFTGTGSAARSISSLQCYPCAQHKAAV